ncbi:MAG TPA: hypothetical protein VJ828_05435 [Lacipirellulaceae bacterium]|nr:hypothetical protein [Lacipirellulaceae bacterium]
MRSIIATCVCLLLMAPPAGAVNIAWLTFHGTDDPEPQASAQGYTTATDQGYVDLLRGDGHSVTRILSATPNQAFIDNLNTFDLVIASRQVNSGAYGEGGDAATERSLWLGGVTKPMMMMSGYILRNNRLQFMSGDTIPDTSTAGPVTLTAAVPSHPIFDGIALDASNNMTFATYPISTPNGVAMRGISAVTGATAGGGTVLATVSADAPAAANNMLIGHWPAGSTIGTTTLGSPRMAFLSGTREPSSPADIQLAGEHDLTTAGDQLFLNSVCFMIGGCGPPLVPGDTDGDGTVEFPDDFEPIRANFRKTVTDRAQGDLVPNGVVDFDDFHQWKSAFVGGGGSLAGLDMSFGANIPEPTAASLLFVAAIVGACTVPRVRV